MAHINIKLERERYRKLRELADKEFNGCLSQAIKSFLPSGKNYEEIQNVD